MPTHDRHRALLTLLERKQRQSIDQLLRALRVSPATLRRDLADLEAGHLLVRYHGGAAHPASLRHEPTFEQRDREAMVAKKAMAQTAAELASTQQTVFLDAGTSCLAVGRALMTRRNLTIISHSVAFASAAVDATARVICIGGELRQGSAALVGGMALSWLENLRADVAFLGASGVSNEGASTTELSESAIKQAFIQRAGKTILVADGSKWGQPAAVRFARWPDVNVWITTVDVAADAREVQQQGPRVITVKIPTSRPRKQP